MKFKITSNLSEVNSMKIYSPAIYMYEKVVFSWADNISLSVNSLFVRHMQHVLLRQIFVSENQKFPHNFAGTMPLQN